MGTTLSIGIWYVTYSGSVHMARIEESVEIKRPIDQVFGYVTSTKNLPTWQSYVLEVEQTLAGRVGIGTTFQGADKVMGQRMAWTSEVTEYEPDKKWGESIYFGSTLIKIQMIFNPVGEGTIYTQIYDIKVGGFLRLFAPMLKSTIRKHTKVSLSKLKDILENQA